MRISSAITRDLNGSDCGRAQEENSLTVNLFLRARAALTNRCKLRSRFRSGSRLAGLLPFDAPSPRPRGAVKPVHPTLLIISS